MSEIIWAIILISFFSYFGGYGLAQLLLPKKLRKYSLWLSPWILYLLITIILILASLGGLAIHPLGIILATTSLIVTLYVLLIKKRWPLINWNIDSNIITIVIASILLNISPLIVRDKFLTTISLGNNDIITYTTNADYLLHNSIAGSFSSDVILTIANLLQDGYRWGPPILEGFFLNLTGFAGYQISYLLQVLLYAFMLPLTYVLGSILTRKPGLRWHSASFLTVLMALNVNTLYMLYHNFWGLVYFWGILMFLTIIFTSHLHVSSKDIKHEFLAMIGLSGLYFTYHEPAIFILLPLFLTGGYLLLTKNNFTWYLQSMLRIAGGLLVIAGVSVANAIVFDFGQAFGGNPNQPIGWQLFREHIPFANPFEMMGFWSIHSFQPLPHIFAFVLSVLIIFILIKGLLSINHQRQKIFMITFTLGAVFFMLFTGYLRHNFFDYNRVVTYTLPVMVVFFGLGLRSILSKRFWLYLCVIGVLSSLLAYSAYKLNRNFIASRAAVDLRYTTLKEIKKLALNEPIYLQGRFMSSTSIWQNIWTGYFVYPHLKNDIFPPRFDSKPDRLSVPDGALVLISKSNPWVKGPKLILNQTVWENEWFILGRICNASECLMKSNQDLSYLNLSQSNYQDSLLLTGWYGHEPDGRWSQGKNSSLRLAINQQKPQYLYLKAQAYAEPMELTISIAGEELVTQTMSADWQEYQVPLTVQLNPGLHLIKFKYSHTYQPAKTSSSSDNRNLAVKFKEIYFD